MSTVLRQEVESRHFWRTGCPFSRGVSSEGDTVDIQRISSERPAEKCLGLLTLSEEEVDMS